MRSKIRQAAAFVDRMFCARPLLLRPAVFAPLIVLVFVAVNFWQLSHVVNDAKRLKKLTSEDSAHYIQIAGLFAQGDLSMSYVERRPHRQPLYPLLLAPAMRLSENNPFWLGTVNIWIGATTILVLYFGILKLLSSPLIAAATAVFYATNSLIVEEVTGRMMTEPLHILLVILIIFSVVSYLNSRKPAALAMAAGLAGLDYLARPNGLFLMLSMMAVLFIDDCAGRRHEINSQSWRLLKHAPKYLAAALIFLLLTTPSWLPRLHYLHQPFSHGYLSNYMWVDTYAEAHTGQAFSSFTWRDYTANHNAADFVLRWCHGFWETFSLPFRNEKIGGIRFPLLYLLASAGVAVSIFTRNRTYLTLAAFFLLQMLPLIWTTLSNPTDRVPYASLFPFELFFAAFALDAVRRLAGWHAGTPGFPETHDSGNLIPPGS